MKILTALKILMEPTKKLNLNSFFEVHSMLVSK